MLRLGLNPYGLTYTLGLQGRGTSRANPNGRGLEGYLEIAADIGAATIEIHNAWLTPLTADERRCVRERIEGEGMVPVISLGPPLEDVQSAIDNARALGARVIRLGLTPVLCGDRAAQGAGWAQMLLHVRSTLRRVAPIAAGLGIDFAIEDHQDFGSDELMAFCSEAGGNVGICLDTGNALAVGEAPMEFARKVAPLVRHLHLKDYNAQWTDEGYRLVRCAIGDGAVPFAEIAALFGDRDDLTASLEPGALEARHIRLFRPAWWECYPDRAARELGPCLAAARVRRLAEDADWRTPWEREAPPEEIVEYEMAMLRKSVENMKALGLWTRH